jgi:hypothetical protein
MPETPIIFEHVELLRETALGWWCRVAGEEIFVGRNVPQPGTTIRVKGDRGRLIVPKWFAEGQGLPVR